MLTKPVRGSSSAHRITLLLRLSSEESTAELLISTLWQFQFIMLLLGNLRCRGVSVGNDGESNTPGSPLAV